MCAGAEPTSVMLADIVAPVWVILDVVIEERVVVGVKVRRISSRPTFGDTADIYNSVSLLVTIKFAGAELPGPGNISKTYVPSTVPSVFQSSAPYSSFIPWKYATSPTTTSD